MTDQHCQVTNMGLDDYNVTGKTVLSVTSAALSSYALLVTSRSKNLRTGQSGKSCTFLKKSNFEPSCKSGLKYVKSYIDGLRCKFLLITTLKR